MSTLAGRPLLVNFFASTCVPCVTEMPAFEEVYQAVGEEVAFLGLAVADRTDAARDLVERTGVTYPTALDQQGEVIDALGRSEERRGGNEGVRKWRSRGSREPE